MKQENIEKLQAIIENIPINKNDEEIVKEIKQEFENGKN